MTRYFISILFILTVVVVVGSYFFLDYWEHRYDEIIARQARVYRIDEKLIWSLIYEETYFRPKARGDADEVGLMQVTPAVAREWAKETNLKDIERRVSEDVYGFLADPERNLQVGCWYYEKLREKYRGFPSETAMTLAAYNAGPSRVEEWVKGANAATLAEADFIQRIEIASTRAYVSSILTRYRAVSSGNK
jgi:soluble lytic murein transglycosylase